jgi:hypothetical protein
MTSSFLRPTASRGVFLALAASGGAAWAVVLVALRPEWAVALLLLAALVCVPLGLALLADEEEPGAPRAWRVLFVVQPAAALLLVAAFLPPAGTTAAALAVPWLLVTVLVAALGLRRLRRDKGWAAEDLALTAGMVFLAAGGGWTFLSRLGATPLDFSPVIVLLTGVHFHFAGFVLPLLTGLLGRAAPGIPTRLAAWSVMAGVPLVALGITVGRGLPPVEVLAAWFLSAGCLLVAFGQVRAALRAGPPARSFLLFVSGLSLVGGMALAAVYALGVFRGAGWLSIETMIPWHGSLNALGFALPGLLAWHLGSRPAANASLLPQDRGARPLAPAGAPGPVGDPAVEGRPDPAERFRAAGRRGPPGLVG